MKRGPDREKVMKGLGCCAIGLYCPDEECPYEQDKEEKPDNCIAALARDALELLKAQEPRVMTLEEVLDHDGPVYITWNSSGSGEWAICPPAEETGARPEWNNLYFRGGPTHLKKADYGRTWIAWTSRPTDEQREAVKWDG